MPGHHESQVVLTKAAAETGGLPGISVILGVLDGLHHFSGHADLHSDADLLEIGGSHLEQLQIVVGSSSTSKVKPSA